MNSVAPIPSLFLTVKHADPRCLLPDKRNARTHSKRQVEQIAASIRSFGFANPILVDPSGQVIAGHGRLLAAKQLGLTEVPTIELAGLSEAQVRALRLADNKIAQGAGWDFDLLRVELAELSSLDLQFDLTATGFSVGEIDVALAGSPAREDDLVPAMPDEPRTRTSWPQRSCQFRQLGFLRGR